MWGNGSEMNKLKTDLVFQFIYRFITVITPLITSPYLSRVLGPEKLGIYSGTYAYANYYLLFAMLGVEFFGNRSIAVVSADREKRRETFWNIYTIQFLSAVISLSVYYLTFGLIFESSRRTVCMLQGLWVLASGMDINWYFFGKQQFKLTVTRNILVKMVSIICIFSFVHRAEDLYIYVFIMAFSMVVSQGVMWPFLLKDIGIAKPSWKAVSKNVGPIVYLFIPVLAMSVFHIMDKTMVDVLSDEANGGYYYNVDRLVNIPLGMITGLGTVMLPRISRLAHSNDTDQAMKLLEKSSELSMFLSCAVAFGLGAIAGTFVPVFFGPGYDPCIIMIVVFVPIIIIKALSDFIRQQYLIPANQDRLYVIAVVCGAGVNLIANYLLIIRFNALGAVIGTFIAEAVVLGIEIWGSRSKMHFVSMFMNHKAYPFIGILMFALVRVLETVLHRQNVLSLFVLVAAGGGIYMLLCVLFWSRKNDSIFAPYVKKIRIRR